MPGEAGGDSGIRVGGLLALSILFNMIKVLKFIVFLALASLLSLGTNKDPEGVADVAASVDTDPSVLPTVELLIAFFLPFFGDPLGEPLGDFLFVPGEDCLLPAADDCRLALLEEFLLFPLVGGVPLLL